MNGQTRPQRGEDGTFEYKTDSPHVLLRKLEGQVVHRNTPLSKKVLRCSQELL